MSLLKETLSKIEGLDEKKMQEAQDRLDSLTKPPGSLGKLEEIAVKLAGISGDVYYKVNQKHHILMAGDHGVVEEGVSAFPAEVTVQMVYNFLHKGAAINVLADQIGAKVTIVDIGIAGEIEADGLINRKIRKGSSNIAKGPAMSKEEAILSLEIGIEMANNAIKSGANLLGTGEMGIGNTTPSSAIIAAVTDEPLSKLVGYGTGIDDERLAHKIEVIKKAIDTNKADTNDGIDVLTKLGGFEIGGMAGVMLGAAANKKPVIIDGLISGAAAIVATLIEPETSNYFIPSHQSVEPGHSAVYKYLGLEAMLNLNMRLGEGTGAILAMYLVEAASDIISGMATFAEANVSGAE